MVETEDGFRGSDIGPTGLIQDQFPSVWHVGGSQSVAAGASHSFVFTIDDPNYVYYIRSCVVSPQANVALLGIFDVAGVEYMTKAGQGHIEFSIGYGSPVYVIDEDVITVTVTNLDTLTRTIKCDLWGVKTMRPDSLGYAPVAEFSGLPTYVSLGNIVTFSDLSSHIPTSWEWDFGDGSEKATTQNPTHEYAEVGLYSVTLKVSNDYGFDMITKTDYVQVSEVAGIGLYTEVDDSNLIAVTETDITTSVLSGGAIVYVYKDYGVDFIDSYDIRFSANVSRQDPSSVQFLAALSNVLTSVWNLSNYYVIVKCDYYDGTYYLLQLILMYAGAVVASHQTTIPIGTTYYFSLLHSLGSTTVDLWVYTDAARQYGMTHLHVTHASCATKFRYHYAFGNGNSVSSAKTSVDIGDFAIQ